MIYFLGLPKNAANLKQDFVKVTLSQNKKPLPMHGQKAYS